MPRLMLSDELWSKLRKILCQHRIYDKRNLRMTVEGMLYRLRVGCPWRDLPKAFGSWNTVYKRFNAWSSSGKWLKIFQALVVGPIWNGPFWMAAMFAPISTAQERRRKALKLLEKVVEATRQKFIWRLTLMACPWNLSSPAVRLTTAQWRRN